MKKVSIIIPAYNSEKYIERSIESALCQSYKNIEVIVVDDGSLDSTLNLCNKYKKIDERLLVITKKNGGVSSARNAGIKKSTGEYIFFLDSDDYLDTEVIEKLVVDNNRDEFLIGCKIKILDDSGERMIKRNEVYSKEDFYNGILDNTLQGFSCGFLFDGEICRAISFKKDLIYCEDLVFLAEYLEKAKIKKIRFLEESCGVLYYTQNESSATNSANDMLKNMLSMKKALEYFDIATNQNYKQQVDNKIVMLYESELQKNRRRSDFGYILKNVPMPKYEGGKIRYKLFSFMYQKSMVFMLLVYYKIRSLFKKVRRKVK